MPAPSQRRVAALRACFVSPRSSSLGAARALGSQGRLAHLTGEVAPGSIDAMDLSTWLIYLLAAIGLSLSPGPNGLLALTHGALHGRRRALYTIFGGAFGFIAVIALSMFGIGALLATSLVQPGRCSSKGHSRR